MSTMSCPKCGAGLAAGTTACPSCGQPIASAVKAAPPAKKSPVAALVILGGGLVVVLGALAAYRSGVLSGTPDTAAAPAAATTPAPGAVTPGAVPASQPAAPGTKPVSGTPVAGVVPAAGTVKPGQPAAAAAPEPAPPPFEKTYLTKAYAIFKVTPEDAELFVDGEDKGHADHFDNGRGHDKYLFRKEGTHYARLDYEGYKTVWIRIIVSDTATEEEVDVEIEMKKK